MSNVLTSGFLANKHTMTAKEIEALVNPAELFKLKTSNINKNENIKTWCEHQTKKMQRCQNQSTRRWKSAVEVNPNYMQHRQGYNEMKSQVDEGNRMLQKTKRGISVLENKMISDSLTQQTRAPILSNEFMKHQINRVMQGTEKSGLFETIR